ncbi:hypothetical protein YC2023_060346 [Brassica napus]
MSNWLIEKIEPSHMFEGVKHVRVHTAVDKLRIIFFDDKQVNPKSRVSTVLSQQLGFMSDNKWFQVVVSE